MDINLVCNLYFYIYRKSKVKRIFVVYNLKIVIYRNKNEFMQINKKKIMFFMCDEVVVVCINI